MTGDNAASMNGTGPGGRWPGNPFANSDPGVDVSTCTSCPPCESPGASCMSWDSIPPRLGGNQSVASAILISGDRTLEDPPAPVDSTSERFDWLTDGLILLEHPRCFCSGGAERDRAPRGFMHEQGENASRSKRVLHSER